MAEKRPSGAFFSALGGVPWLQEQVARFSKRAGGKEPGVEPYSARSEDYHGGGVHTHGLEYTLMHVDWRRKWDEG